MIEIPAPGYQHPGGRRNQPQAAKKTQLLNGHDLVFCVATTRFHFQRNSACNHRSRASQRNISMQGVVKIVSFTLLTLASSHLLA
ncbi:MAG: hypothetical protein P4L87_11620 [Formivibrio sp.]|nr:hypothetical protein [Formivibrio sp.]